MSKSPFIHSKFFTVFPLSDNCDSYKQTPITASIIFSKVCSVFSGFSSVNMVKYFKNKRKGDDKMSPEIHAAIIAAVTSIIVTLPKFIYDCFQEKKRKNFQEKITDIIQNKEDQRAMMQVGANIVWSARVEWIQNVRNVTSEFITAVNDFVVSGDDTARKQNLELIRAKSNLLILYFGPDKHPDTNIDLFNPTSNVSKNENIVKFIKNICENAPAYFLRQTFIEDYHNNILHCNSCKASSDMYESCNIIDASMSNAEKEKSCTAQINNYLKKIKDLRQENQKFKDNIQDFAEIMRIYLKLEWERAKEWNKESTEIYS